MPLLSQILLQWQDVLTILRFKNVDKLKTKQKLKNTPKTAIPLKIVL